MSDINKMISMTLDKYHQLYNECDTLKTNLADALRAVNTQTDLYRGVLVTLAQERDAFGKEEAELKTDCIRLQQEINCLRMKPCQLPDCVADLESLKSIIKGQTGEIERLKGEHEYCKNDYDEVIKNRWDACLDRDRWRTLAMAAKEALSGSVGWMEPVMNGFGVQKESSGYGVLINAKAAFDAFPKEETRG